MPADLPAAFPNTGGGLPQAPTCVAPSGEQGSPQLPLAPTQQTQAHAHHAARELAAPRARRGQPAAGSRGGAPQPPHAAMLKPRKPAKPTAGRTQRRVSQFWAPLNNWWRGFYAEHSRRPMIAEVREWYAAHAQDVWGDLAPTWEETRCHAKCLRPVDQVKKYFQDYRARCRAAEDADKSEAGTSQVRRLRNPLVWQTTCVQRTASPQLPTRTTTVSVC